jgi:hypothetical protein
MSEMVEIEESDFLEVDASLIKGVAEVFNQLIKTVKAKLVYPASSRLPQQFLEKLHADLSALLGDVRSLKLKVESDAVVFESNPIYKSITKADNFAHPFFRDGIIELEFRAGITFDELEKFVEILSMVSRSAYIEDDLATLLWEAGFEKIFYKLMDDSIDIETFEYGASNLKTPLSSTGVDFSELFIPERDLNLTEEDFDLESDKNKGKKCPTAYKNVPDDVADYISKITEYDESEKSAIAELLKEDDDFKFKQYVIDIMFEILGMDTDNASYMETLDMISKVRDDFIKSGEMESAIAIFNMARELKEALKNLGDEKEKKIEEFLKSFGASERIRVMVDMLNNSKDANYALVAEYLSMFSWEAINPLIWALGELSHYPARRAVCQALETISVDHIDVLGKGAENPRWYVVRNVVMILGKIGSAQALNHFQRTIKHSDLRVRKETVVSAARIDSELSIDLLIIALKDESEGLQTMALRELVNRKSGKAFDHLEKMIDDKEFKNRSTDQIKEILAGYAQLGGLNAFEKLKKMATRPILIPSEKTERIKFYAIMALGYLQNNQAYQLLSKIANSRNKKAGDAARRAMHKFLKERGIA